MISYNVRLIQYPNGEAQVRRYSVALTKHTENPCESDTLENDIFSATRSSSSEQEDSYSSTQKNQADNERRSYSRSKQKVFEYARCVSWEWFVTFTFSPDKIDRYDYTLCSKVIRKWLNNQRRNAPDLKYLIVPEIHKDGAYHFHGLLASIGDMRFVDSGHTTKTKEPIFNMVKWSYGFTTATKINDTHKVSKYIGKYITKDLCCVTKGQQRYFVSSNLPKPNTTVFLVENDTDFSNLLETLSASLGMKVVNISSSYKNDAYVNVDYYELRESEDSMSIQEAFDAFILSRKLADLSSKSISAYQQFVRPFLQAVGANTEIETLTQADINNYIAAVIEKPLSRSSKATYIRHLKIFLRWCENEYTVNYTAKRIKIPKSPKREVRIYSEDEMAMIFDHVSAENEWLTIRNQCIIALMYDSGLRQSEVCDIRWKNISLDADRMIVHGKGDKERTVPLGKFSKHLLKKYAALCPYKSDFAFVTRRGDALTCNAVKLMVSRLAQELPFDLCSHKLRHNFATNFCLSQYEHFGQIDIYKLMYLMGHEEIETTQRYLHFAYEIIASRDNISMLDKMKKVSECFT